MTERLAADITPAAQTTGSLQAALPERDKKLQGEWYSYPARCFRRMLRALRLMGCPVIFFAAAYVSPYKERWGLGRRDMRSTRTSFDRPRDVALLSK